MGWAGGSILLEECWKHIAPKVNKKYRVKLLLALMGEFQHEDCDNMCELEGMDKKKYPEVKEALRIFYNG